MYLYESNDIFTDELLYKERYGIKKQTHDYIVLEQT
jgi:hypothetical protein